MEKELMFIIENNNLFLEREIVTVDIPLLFVCIDNDEQRYLCLCTDSDDLSYLVAKTESKNILDLIKSTIPMKKAFENCNHIWRVSTGDSVIEDKINKVLYKDIPEIDLPQDGATLGFTNSYLDEYKVELELDKKIYPFQTPSRLIIPFEFFFEKIEFKFVNDHFQQIDYSNQEKMSYIFNRTLIA